jgi:NADH-quinone oxidoreductase subunit E
MSTTEAFTVPPSLHAALDECISHYPERRSAVLMVLHALQAHFGFISREAIEWTAAKLGLQPINVYELVTFYPMFHDEPVGRYHLKVCRTLSCALAGAQQLHTHLCQRLALDPQTHGPQTTPDGRFTLEAVECLASCGTGPVMMVNDDFYEKLTREKADEIIKRCQGDGVVG